MANELGRRHAKDSLATQNHSRERRVGGCRLHPDFSKSSRPISIRLISLVPAPIS